MHIVLKSESFSRPLDVQIDDERRSLDNLFSLLAPHVVSSIEIIDWKEAKLPKKISKFAELKEIHFVRCHALERVPEELSALPHLEHVSFTDCADFSSLEGIDRCAQCRVLRVCRCDNFEGIDVDLSGLSSLVAIDLSRCANLSYVDLSKLPRQIAILDLHGASRARFDASQLDALDLRSTQIQDYSRLSSGMELQRPDDMAAQLENAMTSRSTAGLDD